jgi:hypothetical protein
MQETQWGLEFNGTHQFLVYAENVNLMDENIQDALTDSRLAFQHTCFCYTGQIYKHFIWPVIKPRFQINYTKSPDFFTTWSVLQLTWALC